MKLSYLGNKGLLDDLWSGHQVSQKRGIFGRSKQLGAVDAAERCCGYADNERAQHEQRGRAVDLAGRKRRKAAHV